MSHADRIERADGGATPPSPAAQPTPPNAAAPTTLRAGPLHGLIAALLAGGLTWTVAQAVDPLFSISVDLTALLGGIVAAAAGCAAAWVGAVLRQRLQLNADYSPLARTIMVHASMLGVLAMGIGVGLACPYRRWGLWVNAVLGCLLGAVLAALVYPAAVAFFFFRVNTDSLLPYPSTALLAWLVTAAVLIALAATSLGAREAPEPPGN